MNIAILGYGIEGESVYKYYRVKYPDASFTVYDNKPEPKNPLPSGVVFVGSVTDFKGITADLAVKTPAIPPWEVEVTGEVTTMTREFLQNCPAPVIGVTGTKGKGTTASLIKSILDASAKKTWLVGNIGVGAFDVLDQVQPDDIVIYELSSFQLWGLDVSPHVAVVLGIEPEHLDVHKDFDDYLNAKANIRRFQGMDDVCLYHPTNEYARAIAATPLVNAPVVDREYGGSIEFAQRYAVQDDDQVYVEDGYFCVQGRRICSTEHLKLPGKHNIENACAAMSAVSELRLDVTDEQYAKGLKSFTGLPHRLKFVRELGDVKYYDDSIATTPGSAIAALASFAQPKVIILGGSYKGATYDELAAKIAASDVREVILIGDEAPKIETAIKAQGVTNYKNLGLAVTMADIVNEAKEVAQPGDVVILSPSCASFDMFRSYADRGEQFIRVVQNL